MAVALKQVDHFGTNAAFDDIPDDMWLHRWLHMSSGGPIMLNSTQVVQLVEGNCHQEAASIVRCRERWTKRNPSSWDERAYAQQSIKRDILMYDIT